jgi:hypothetical protein
MKAQRESRTGRWEGGRQTLVSIAIANVTTPDENVLVVEGRYELGISNDILDKLGVILVFRGYEDDTHESELVFGFPERIPVRADKEPWKSSSTLVAGGGRRRWARDG